MAAPTLVASSVSNHSDAGGTETTGSVSWSSGDVVVVIGLTANGTNTLATPTTTGSGLSFSLVISDGPLGGADTNASAYVWAATASASSSGTISSVRTGAAHSVIGVWVYSGSDGIGNSNSVEGATATQTVSLTRAQANSAVIWGNTDWNSAGDTTITITPASGATSRLGTGGLDTTDYTVYMVDWTDQGATGTTAYGATGLSGAQSTMVVVEVRGTAGGGGGSAFPHYYYQRLRTA